MSTLKIEPLKGRRFGLIADAHIHPGKTPPLPPSLPQLFAGVDGIIALGDMGEASALDALERIAPLVAMTGEDDAHGDTRLEPRRLLGCGGLCIAALFDGAKSGLLAANDPLAVPEDFETAFVPIFGRKPDILLCASTHKPVTAHAAGVLIVNPGSPTLADVPNVAVLEIAGGLARVEQIRIG